MRLSIFTTFKDPAFRGDIFKQASKCYEDLADEVIYVDGSGGFMPYREKNYIKSYWPREFNWPLIGQQFQKGYEAATGDWVIHMDTDWLFHEKDFESIRKACEQNSNAPAISFWKYQFYLPDRYTLKCRLVIAINKAKVGNRVKFDSSGDLCQPSLDGKYIKPSDVPEARIPFYNYEKIIKTEAQIADDAGRMDRAYKRHFGKNLYKTNELTPYEGWLKMAIGRFNKPNEKIPLEKHPKYIKEIIEKLKPEQFGYSGFGHLGVNDYVKSS